MTRKTCGALVLLPVFFLIGSAISTGAEEFARYCNGRFGFCIDYPTRLVPEPEPDNGDGKRFYDSEGFLMIASGINNANDDTLLGEMRSQARDFDKITYRAKGKDWFVLSGTKGTHILYRKAYVGPDAINHLFIEYPADLKKKYGPVVTKVSRSFQPGELGHAP